MRTLSRTLFHDLSPASYAFNWLLAIYMSQRCLVARACKIELYCFPQQVDACYSYLGTIITEIIVEEKNIFDFEKLGDKYIELLRGSTDPQTRQAALVIELPMKQWAKLYAHRIRKISNKDAHRETHVLPLLTQPTCW